METTMSNATVKSFVKRAAAAAILIAVAAGATGASAGAASSLSAAKQSETIFNPKAVPGCWTDNGYGRYSSCDAG
jgi:nitrous oxide reductase